MTDSKSDALDPKAAMRAALERKKTGQQSGQQSQGGGSKISGGPHEQLGGKRQFRRKSGG